MQGRLFIFVLLCEMSLFTQATFKIFLFITGFEQCDYGVTLCYLYSYFLYLEVFEVFGQWKQAAYPDLCGFLEMLFLIGLGGSSLDSSNFLTGMF